MSRFCILESTVFHFSTYSVIALEEKVGHRGQQGGGGAF